MMAGAKATFTFDTPLMGQDFVEFARVAPDLFKRKVPSAARRVTRFAKRELEALTPGPAKHPIMWTSEKQRRAFFATNGFGRGIPTKRMGGIEDGWEVRTRIEQDASGEFVIINTAPYAQWVIGKDQQRFHEITGWPNINSATFRDTEARIADFAGDEIENLHTSLIDDYLEKFG